MAAEGRGLWVHSSSLLATLLGVAAQEPSGLSTTGEASGPGGPSCLGPGVLALWLAQSPFPAPLCLPRVRQVTPGLYQPPQPRLQDPHRFASWSHRLSAASRHVGSLQPTQAIGELQGPGFPGWLQAAWEVIFSQSLKCELGQKPPCSQFSSGPM